VRGRLAPLLGTVQAPRTRLAQRGGTGDDGDAGAMSLGTARAFIRANRCHDSTCRGSRDASQQLTDEQRGTASRSRPTSRAHRIAADVPRLMRTPTHRMSLRPARKRRAGRRPHRLLAREPALDALPEQGSPRSPPPARVCLPCRAASPRTSRRRVVTPSHQRLTEPLAAGLYMSGRPRAGDEGETRLELQRRDPQPHFCTFSGWWPAHPEQEPDAYQERPPKKEPP